MQSKPLKQNPLLTSLSSGCRASQKVVPLLPLGFQAAVGSLPLLVMSPFIHGSFRCRLQHAELPPCIKLQSPSEQPSLSLLKGILI